MKKRRGKLWFAPHPVCAVQADAICGSPSVMSSHSPRWALRLSRYICTGLSAGWREVYK